MIDFSLNCIPGATSADVEKTGPLPLKAQPISLWLKSKAEQLSGRRPTWLGQLSSEKWFVNCNPDWRSFLEEQRQIQSQTCSWQIVDSIILFGSCWYWKSWQSLLQWFSHTNCNNCRTFP